MKYLLILLNIFLFINPDNLYSQDRSPLLTKGMSYIEVVKLWGSPQEKIEKEAKRREIWVYKNNSKLVFDNGILTSHLNDSNVDVMLPENAALLLKQGEKEKATQESVTPLANQDVVDDILSEIMKDPSNLEPGEPKPNVSGMPVSPPQVINQIPPPEQIQ